MSISFVYNFLFFRACSCKILCCAKQWMYNISCGSYRWNKNVERKKKERKKETIEVKWKQCVCSLINIFFLRVTNELNELLEVSVYTFQLIGRKVLISDLIKSVFVSRIKLCFFFNLFIYFFFFTGTYIQYTYVCIYVRYQRNMKY